MDGLRSSKRNLTVLRVKRKAGEDPVDALVISGLTGSKRARLGPNGGASTIPTGAANAGTNPAIDLRVFRLATSVTHRDAGMWHRDVKTVQSGRQRAIIAPSAPPKITPQQDLNRIRERTRQARFHVVSQERDRAHQLQVIDVAADNDADTDAAVAAAVDPEQANADADAAGAAVAASVASASGAPRAIQPTPITVPVAYGAVPGLTSTSAAVPAAPRGQAQPQRHPETAGAAPASQAEALMMSLMPMVNDYLRIHDPDELEANRRPEPERAGSTTPMEEVAPTGSVQWVYDVYIQDTIGNVADLQRIEGIELAPEHAVIFMDDASDSEAGAHDEGDSDSNAESYAANSYPEDEDGEEAFNLSEAESDYRDEAYGDAYRGHRNDFVTAPSATAMGQFDDEDPNARALASFAAQSEAYTAWRDAPEFDATSSDDAMSD
ncbi:hypothetical protein CXG81DRAFT_16528 [Caulochytrium protostelioides]|uniref:Probable RNA polymerase II nuclear localization protein SLC7A6OS n=1 Tax=Caulochytrium protostelioides TaxID=1555241 RepID=A0A4P9XEI2_9FUNG|nr:hypothetical protein CXG81DRAFT_16528 [Caulochytrium protostelioides]|eukprot:RKP03953.1 hypothetical protein CXG81DRAFT_16528 [Caulochytrium protostelioides]